MSDLPKPAPKPCGSCPYRCDVPSGIWERHEYEKLPQYDGPTWGQNVALFMCHQRDGNLCSGWLACHDPQELLALRFPGRVDESAYSYKTKSLFASGREAHDHGVRDLTALGDKAAKMMAGIIKKQRADV